MNEKPNAAPDVEAIMALAQDYKDEPWPDENHTYAALRAAVERIVRYAEEMRQDCIARTETISNLVTGQDALKERAERAEQEHQFQAALVKELLPYQERAVRAEQEAAALRELLGEAREELSDVEYDADPPKRVVGLLARIDAVLNHAKAD